MCFLEQNYLIYQFKKSELYVVKPKYIQNKIKDKMRVSI